MKNINTIIIVAVIFILVAAGGGFFAGMQYQKSQNPFGANRNFAGANGQFFMGRGANGGTSGQAFRPVRGQVLSLGNNTLTVKQQDGTTRIVVVGSSTTFVNTQKASLSDLKQGDTIMVIGSANSDGSITATDVQINPQQFRMGTPAPTQ